MATAKIFYKGSLRCEAIHERSGNTLITDAPVDNNGKGEAFSPTDLLATSLGSCMITVMGIQANKWGMDLKGGLVEVQKIMLADPRRVGEIRLKIEIEGNFNSDQRSVLEEKAENCPVAKSLAGELKQSVEFIWL